MWRIKMRARRIYRFEQNENNGCWYSQDGSFNNLYGTVCENVPMPLDNRPKNFRAGCFSLNDLYKWGTPECLKKMKARVVVVLSKEYKCLPMGEVIYNESSTYYKKIIKQY